MSGTGNGCNDPRGIGDDCICEIHTCILCVASRSAPMPLLRRWPIDLQPSLRTTSYCGRSLFCACYSQTLADGEMSSMRPGPKGSGTLCPFRAASTSVRLVKHCQEVLTRGREVLFRRATRRYEKPCYASFFPSMPTERLELF